MSAFKLLPNESRLSCGAKGERSQRQFYSKAPASFKRVLDGGGGCFGNCRPMSAPTGNPINPPVTRNSFT